MVSAKALPAAAKSRAQSRAEPPADAPCIGVEAVIQLQIRKDLS
jgi:hypothetical protein